MVRLLPIRHCACHPALKLPHCTPVVRPPRRCFPKQRIKNLKRLCSCLQYGLITFLLILLILWIGKTVEDNHAERAQSTLDLYTKPEVCALLHVPGKILNATEAEQRQRSFSPSNQTLQPFVTQTLPNITFAHQKQDAIVAHCGDCGACSTLQDILIYNDTKNTLTDTTTKCAKMGLIGGRRRATKCMQEHVGLSEQCTECWVENIMCDVRLCVFTCLWRLLTSFGDKKSIGGELNDCTRCDELRCGRQFLECAGANRRRTGIVSDIARDMDQEVCKDAAEEFWRSQEIQLWYQSVAPNEMTEPETRLLRG